MAWSCRIGKRLYCNRTRRRYTDHLQKKHYELWTGILDSNGDLVDFWHRAGRSQPSIVEALREHYLIVCPVRPARVEDVFRTTAPMSEDLQESICGLTHAIREATEQRKREFDILKSLSELATKHDLNIILERLNKMAATLDDVLKDVTDESTVIDGISTLLSGLQKQLKDALANAADKAKVDAIFAAVESNKAKLAKAVTDNTPAAPPTP